MGASFCTVIEEEHASKNEVLQNSEENFRKVFTFPDVYKKAWLPRQRSTTKEKSAGCDEKEGQWDTSNTTAETKPLSESQVSNTGNKCGRN